MTEKIRVAEVLLEATNSLAGDSARADAELLLAQALGQSRSWLYAHSDDKLGEDQVRDFRALLERRRRGEPVAQILGVREFWSLPLMVTVDTLIPRPETELLVELALQRIPAESSPRVLDLGTGTGAIALAIAKERPQAEVTAIDADPRTLRVAKKNAARLGLDQVHFLLGNWFSAVRDERYDVILSNPPYIADDDPHLLQGDLRFEPRSALASGTDGLDALRQIASEAARHLRAGGCVLLEHGFDQGAAVRALLAASGFTDVTTHADMEGRDRVSSGNYQV
jgi:release factor glutamine methyltransferase